MSIVTPNINLPQWESDQKPNREAFNNVFATIDTAVGGKADKSYVDAGLSGKAEKSTSIKSFTPKLYEDDKLINATYFHQEGSYYIQDKTAHISIHICVKSFNETLSSNRLNISNLPVFANNPSVPFIAATVGYWYGSSEAIIFHASNGDNRLFAGNAFTGGSFAANKMVNGFHIVVSVSYPIS